MAIYSTFLQRAYDQVVHDVAMQKLPVRFAIDRAGLVGSDGPTHAGSFDITFYLLYLTLLLWRQVVKMAYKMMKVSSNINDRPSAFRYPRGVGVFSDYETGNIEIGKGHIIINGDNVAILNLGTG